MCAFCVIVSLVGYLPIQYYKDARYHEHKIHWYQTGKGGTSVPKHKKKTVQNISLVIYLYNIIRMHGTMNIKKKKV